MIAASQIEDAHNVDILEVAQRLGAKMKRVAKAEWAGPCPACGGTDRFAVNTKRGVFHCRGVGQGGDVIAMVQHALCADFAGAIEFLAGKKAIANDERLSNVAHGKHLPIVADSSPSAQTEAIVAGIVAELLPILGTDGERYLKERRRIDTAAIADVLERADAIGWHGSVYFKEDGHPLHGQRLGCIIGIMTDPVTAEPTGAVSRTYLDRDGRKVGKAKTLGSPVGIVRLSRGEDVLGGLHLAEGIETCLSAMSIGLRPMW
jgi:hypothetical protein